MGCLPLQVPIHTQQQGIQDVVGYKNGGLPEESFCGFVIMPQR